MWRWLAKHIPANVFSEFAKILFASNAVVAQYGFSWQLNLLVGWKGAVAVAIAVFAATLNWNWLNCKLIQFSCGWNHRIAVLHKLKHSKPDYVRLFCFSLRQLNEFLNKSCELESHYVFKHVWNLPNCGQTNTWATDDGNKPISWWKDFHGVKIVCKSGKSDYVMRIPHEITDREFKSSHLRITNCNHSLRGLRMIQNMLIWR